jgi:hypothetical protein
LSSRPFIPLPRFIRSRRPITPTPIYIIYMYSL